MKTLVVLIVFVLGCGEQPSAPLTAEYSVEQPSLDQEEAMLVFSGPGTDNLRIRVKGEPGEAAITRSRGNVEGKDYECEFMMLVANTGKIVLTDVKLNGKAVPQKSE